MNISLDFSKYFMMKNNIISFNSVLRQKDLCYRLQCNEIYCYIIPDKLMSSYTFFPAAIVKKGTFNITYNSQTCN